MPRRRVQALELEDQPWLPAGLRRSITDIIHIAHLAFGVYRLWTPRIARVLAACDETRIVDLCSGSGGPALAIGERLRRDHGLPVSLTLTDLYPNRHAVARIDKPWARYCETPVDAAAVPEELGGLRTVFVGFHHMPEEQARAILVDAFRRRTPLCIFELTNNSMGALLTYLVALVPLVWALTPFVRPLSWRRLLLTYLVPLVPLLVTWDGLASHLRTYSVDELRELTAGLDAPDYCWEAGYLRHLLVPYRLPYLVGCPSGAAGPARR